MKCQHCYADVERSAIERLGPYDKRTGERFCDPRYSTIMHKIMPVITVRK